MDTQTLQQFEIFSGLSPRALNGLAGSFTYKKAEHNEKIVVQGSISDGVFLVLSGKVAIMREAKNGTLVPIHQIEQGALFGTLATLDGGPRGAHCVAKGEVEYAFLNKVDFLELVRSKSAMGMGFQVAVIRAIFHDIRRTNEQLAELSSLDPIEDITPL